MTLPVFFSICLGSLMGVAGLPAAAQDAPPNRPDAESGTVAATALPIDAVRPAPRPDRARLASAAQNQAFVRWIEAFRGRALAQGVSPQTFDTAFSDVYYDTAVISRDRNQSEFVMPIWRYLDRAVSETRIENGRDALDRHASLLEAIESRYGVDKEIVVAIWGLESAYGTHRGEEDVIRALATLAFDGRRGRFFESQLVAALRILERGDTSSDRMTGSWAGAMGHTQFIPTSYIAYAVDFTGDGRRDVWGEDPADALASTAAYLSQYGWEEGVPWGVEVNLPQGFDYTLAARSERRLPSEWAELGVTPVEGDPVADHAAASLLLPAGADGAAFLVFPNFDVISRYNAADAYVIGVGHLADRLAGAGPLEAAWPTDERPLTRAEREELQRRLTATGFDTGGIDGRIGPMTRAALRAYQSGRGMIPDGHPSLRVLQSLRGT